MTQRIVINISASVDWCGNPVGIIRVEHELTKQLYRLSPNTLVAVCLDKNTQSWKQVSSFLFHEFVTNDRVFDIDANKIDVNNLDDFQPLENDQFVSVGSDWSFNVPDLVVKTYGTNKVLIPACYDLIPLLFPEHTPGVEFYQQFVHHYTGVAQYAKSVFAISENSKRDLLAFWKKSGITITPPVHVIPLAGLKNSIELPVLTPHDQTNFDNLRKNGDYVIFVSTVEPRKNHQLLLDIWRELFRERQGDCPQLLIVGNRGWGSNELLEKMMQMSATKAHRIVWWDGVGDELLAHLYAHSLFSVFPSIYEGWGLAATEALSFGKVCVVSNNSALGQATQGLMPSYHPFDFPSWLQEIKHLIDNKDYRESLEKRIQENMQQRTWDDFGTEFYNRLIR